MRFRVHLSTYVDNRDGTFSVDVSCFRPHEPGGPEKEFRSTQTQRKPRALFDADDVIAFYQAKHRRADFAAAGVA